MPPLSLSLLNLPPSSHTCPPYPHSLLTQPAPPLPPHSLPELLELKERLRKDTTTTAGGAAFSAVFMTGSGSTLVCMGGDVPPAFLKEQQYKVCAMKSYNLTQYFSCQLAMLSFHLISPLPLSLLLHVLCAGSVCVPSAPDCAQAGPVVRAGAAGCVEPVSLPLFTGVAATVLCTLCQLCPSGGPAGVLPVEISVGRDHASRNEAALQLRDAFGGIQGGGIGAAGVWSSSRGLCS